MTSLPQTPKEQRSWYSIIWNFCKKRPWTWKLAASLSLGAITIGGTIAATLIVSDTQTSELLTIPISRPKAPERDLTWLADLNYCATDSGRTIQDCLTQVRLWLDYAEEIVTGEEALRYRAKASEYMSNSQVETCNQKPQLVCLGSFARNINRDLEKAYALPESQRNAAIIGAISQYQALVDARLGSPKTAPVPSRGIILRIFEKAESDIALYLGTDRTSNTALDNLGEFYEYDSELPNRSNEPHPKRR
ncbi:hypothetical protein IQ249_15040 [Lusitaniella coriacea LEGE 07157]|uniref:Uncharacterized protein n=1 Tax=Lusitaniella coriacea LEGE 07157 TaxID=945747 RepID=A0A8J7J3W5_9CYAN|nr:hypothetical protein [Lusitaniella coriacea]MBE9117214.1 hypothetical protein [Lusitaniella coriacea LEGE 07157]